MNRIKDMDSLRLIKFSGEWEEHDQMDEWMLELLETG